VSPAASVIVRARNEEAALGRALEALRKQTVQAEVLVVDSGSTDGTLEIARRWSDRVIQVPPQHFTYGYALNVGARAANAPIHFALSAHCVPERPDWIELSLGHYDDPAVAATHGARYLPDGRPVGAPFHQDAAQARANPHWGFSNHASSWRGAVWAEFPFNERLEAAEDREWVLRVLDAGWVVAIDPRLWVGMSHAWRGGLRNPYQRGKRNARAVAKFAPGPPYRLSDCLREWWSRMPDDLHSPWLYRLDYRRMAALAGKYAGYRASRSS
jgi:glycosyltransferase involved in cell wall biosynthesis